MNEKFAYFIMDMIKWFAVEFSKIYGQQEAVKKLTKTLDKIYRPKIPAVLNDREENIAKGL